MAGYVLIAGAVLNLAIALARGVHATAMPAIRTEKDPKRSPTLFNVVPQISPVRNPTLLRGILGLTPPLPPSRGGRDGYGHRFWSS